MRACGACRPGGRDGWAWRRFEVRRLRKRGGVGVRRETPSRPPSLRPNRTGRVAGWVFAGSVVQLGAQAGRPFGVAGAWAATVSSEGPWVLHLHSETMATRRLKRAVRPRPTAAVRPSGGLSLTDASARCEASRYECNAAPGVWFHYQKSPLSPSATLRGVPMHRPGPR